MNADNLIGLVIAVAMILFLFVALLFPTRF